jgi:hypothetical protein
VLTGIIGSILANLSESISPTLALLLGVVYTAFLLFAMYQVLSRTASEDQSSREIARITAEKEEYSRIFSRETGEHALSLQQRALAAVTKITRTHTDALITMKKKCSGASAEEVLKIQIDSREKMVTEVMERLRSMFQGDTRGVDTTKYPYSIFKLAIFEPKLISGDTCLVRTYFDYPDGILPHDNTRVISIASHPSASHVRAFKLQQIEIIEDIPSEARRQNGSGRWEDLRPNQSKDYQSMFCAPIVQGEKETPERKALGVLVVDTNRTRYFLEASDYKLFLYKLLSPFRTLLTMALKLTEE